MKRNNLIFVGFNFYLYFTSSPRTFPLRSPNLCLLLVRIPVLVDRLSSLPLQQHPPSVPPRDIPPVFGRLLVVIPVPLEASPLQVPRVLQYALFVVQPWEEPVDPLEDRLLQDGVDRPRQRSHNCNFFVCWTRSFLLGKGNDTRSRL